MVATGQEMVRGKNSSRSGKCQGILLRETWHFEEKSGKFEFVMLNARRNISSHMGAKDCYNQRLEMTTIFEILHLFGQGNLPFIREKSGNFENGCLWQPCSNNI